MENSKIVLFGSGDYGKRAIWEYGREHIACIIDNDNAKWGTLLEGIPIINLAEYKKKYRDIPICISSTYAPEIIGQLNTENVSNYQIYLPQIQYYYSPDEIIVNPYEYKKEAENESAWNKSIAENRDMVYIRECVQTLRKSLPLFNHIEIETYNRCNGGCSFCPVSVKNETRPEMHMKESLFRKIIDDLHSLHYKGKIALFSNNEPFLDERIIDFHRYARRKLPDARFHLFTNGTKLTMSLFKEIEPLLDELIIDNYNDSFQLNANSKAIYEYCKIHPELIEKVSIVLRKTNEILTTRGGDAPNRYEKVSYANTTCMLPFRQMVVRPDGKVSLCCNDPLGRYQLGDLNRQNVEDVWFGKEFQEIRELIAQGRSTIEKCCYCDVFTIA